MFSDQDFHALRVPDDSIAGPDRGRLEGVGIALANAVRADGPHSDAPTAWPSIDAVDDPGHLGQFRTPTLRGVALTGPYGHAGSLATLADVIRHDARAGLPPQDPRAQGVTDPALLPFDPSPDEVDALVAFLASLTPTPP